MGQTVEIRNAVAIDDLLLIDTDRSFTGQDGREMTKENLGGGFPARLAAALFESDAAIEHVYILQNTVSLRRDRDWDDTSADSARAVTAKFLRFYEG